jgi:hypothetical protein
MGNVEPVSSDVDRFVAQVEPPLRAIVEALRATIRSEVPALHEQIKRGIPWYSLRDAVCYIARYSKHVNLGFFFGAHIRDTKNLLEGTGRNLRHAKIQSPSEARSGNIRELIRNAVVYDPR